tara:strand:+ start:3351 stop:4352 length:1002 start_codon:yes stop_codon:yes gene_type:complete
MANKKISQLNSVGATVGVKAADLLPIASGAGSTYKTAKASAQQIQNFVLNPMNVDNGSVIGFTGSEHIVFKKTNWDNASTSVADNPYLQVRLSDGRLITGSGIAAATSASDNMGNCTATQDIKMQAFSMTGCGNVGFGNNNTIGGLDRSRIFNSDGNGTDLQVLAYRDLQLSGNRNIDINAHSLDLSDTPITGNVSIENGNLNFPASQGHITVDDVIYRKRAYNFSPKDVGSSADNIDWSLGNVQHAELPNTTASRAYTFSNDVNGQTLTMYIHNNYGGEGTATFNVAQGTTVYWGAEYENQAPKIAQNKTNLYTFIKIDDKIWASAITGYNF